MPYFGIGVVLGDGVRIPIISVGRAFLNVDNNYSLSLRDILSTPFVVANLLSVNKTIIYNKVFVECDIFGFYVKDLQTKKVKLEGSSMHGIYMLQVLMANEGKGTIRPTLLALMLFQVSLETWHERLGHPSFPMIKNALHNYVISSDSGKVNAKTPFCTVYNLAKSHKLFLKILIKKLMLFFVCCTRICGLHLVLLIQVSNTFFPLLMILINLLGFFYYNQKIIP